MTRWITEYLGTSAWDQVSQSEGIYLLDVRELVDKGGNEPKVVKSKIDEALAHLQNSEKVIVCCDYGMSRSNAIAAGILTLQENISIEEAILRVIAATGESAIKIEVLSAVRKSLVSEAQEISSYETNEHQLLITGASGFIGSSLLPKLKQRYEVIAPTSKEINLLKETIALDLLVKEQKINTILHLANPRIYSTNESIGTALVMLKNVLDVCKENGVFLVYLSSWEIYSGYKTSELKADESLAPCPGGTYGQTKFLCESLIEHYRNFYGLSCTILRSSPVYGLGSDRPKFIWNFLNKALCNEEIIPHKYLNGYPMLDLLHVDDLCSAICTAISLQVKTVINLGTGIGTSTTQVAEQIIEYISSKSKIRHNTIAGYTSNIFMDTNKAFSILGWQPEITLSQGLENLVKTQIST